jgi:hypothetical protein
MIRAADVSAGRQEVVTPAPIMTMLVIARVWLLYDDAEVAENQQNTGIDGVRLAVKRSRYQNIPMSELSRAAK